MRSQQPAAAARDAAYFDQWYADMATSPGRDAIVAHTLGLPPELQSTSLLSWQGIAEVTEELRMVADGLLLDLACGRGGYGIEVARRTGARLLGVDFSGVALEQARSSSASLLPRAWSQGVDTGSAIRSRNLMRSQESSMKLAGRSKTRPGTTR